MRSVTLGFLAWLEVRTRQYWHEKSLSSPREEEQKMLLFSNFENLQAYIFMQYCGTIIAIILTVVIISAFLAARRETLAGNLTRP